MSLFPTRTHGAGAVRNRNEKKKQMCFSAQTTEIDRGRIAMNSVLFWNSILLEVSRRDFTRGFPNGQQPGPIRTARAMAIVHLAIHDAIALRNNPAAAYLNKKRVAHGITTPLMGDVDDIIAGAAAASLRALYPASVDFVDSAIGQVNPSAFEQGELVADMLLLHRANDGSDTMVTGPQLPNLGHGEHRADPYEPGQPRLGPVWGNVTRFLNACHQPLADFPGRANAPNFLSNAAYRADFEEVRDFGSVVRGPRTADQERIGVYWGYDGANNLGVPPRLYNQITREIVRDRNISRARLAELFAVINVALADAGIDAWHYKYEQNLWRPVVGIRAEAAPHGDVFWAPLGVPQTNGAPGTFSPPFPAYPSGHATFGAALMQALRLGLNGVQGPITLQEVLDFEEGSGTSIPNEEFTFVSDELNGISADPDGSVRTRLEKTFVSFAEPVWENSVSRIYLGVHWRFDGMPRNAGENVGGVPLGLAIGQESHDFFNTGASLAAS